MRFFAVSQEWYYGILRDSLNEVQNITQMLRECEFNSRISRLLNVHKMRVHNVKTQRVLPIRGIAGIAVYNGICVIIRQPCSVVTFTTGFGDFSALCTNERLQLGYKTVTNPAAEGKIWFTKFIKTA